MTRGREENALHVVAESMAEARQQFVDAMKRDQADRGLTDATERATEAVRGLKDDGPVKLVNTRIAQLTQDAEQGEKRAEWWEQVGARLDQQHAHQQGEKDEQAAVIQAATEQAEQIRAEVPEPLVALATTEGTDHLSIIGQEAAARAKLAAAGRFGKRGARKEYRAASEQMQANRSRLTDRWSTTPNSVTDLTAWATRSAERVADLDPRLLSTQQSAAAARAAGEAMNDRHRRERAGLLADIFGIERVRRDPPRYEFTHPDREATEATNTATAARTEVATLRSLPVKEAADRIEAQREAAE